MLRFLLVTVYLVVVGSTPVKKGEDGSRIMNGDVATEGQFPFAVSVQYRREDGTHGHQCTFSLITTKTCLGASHCVVEKGALINIEEYCGIVGATHQEENTDCYDFASVHSHEKYDEKEVIYDIALLIFKEAVTLADNIQTLKLAGPGKEILGERVTALGWGLTAPDGDASSELKYTSLNVEEQSVCNQIFTPDLIDNQVCLVGDNSGTCQGDSGAPIVLTDTDIQIALVSFGKADCDTNPSVNTDVRKFIDWIKEHADGEPEIVE